VKIDIKRERWERGGDTKEKRER